ncbi:MAG TPA: lmo0937 family membrane protein [Candidatus Saccharimonadales bacterium]|nr:lmo0937 family membrane protein [Candidatus Saccharimonadales bacterium]
MLWAIIIILILMWILGITVHIGGGLIHLLLIIALIALIYNLVVGARSREE